MIAVRAVGFKAHDALARSGGHATLLAALTESMYLTAADEIIWLGGANAALHARAILTPALAERRFGDPSPALAEDAGFAGVRSAGGLGGPSRPPIYIDVSAVVPWRPRVPINPPVEMVITGAGTLLDGLRRSALSTPPLGLGRLLVGASPAFPLDGARPHAVALAHACVCADTGGVSAAAGALLGLGPGLTPSGDDFLGGAFFARRVLAGSERDPHWTRATRGVVEQARERTHAISAALLSDMTEGHGHAPLHDLATALAAGPAAAADALAAAHRLARIGHSSGWDILTGLLAALLGPSALG